MTEQFTHNLKLAVMNEDGSIMSGEKAGYILSQVYAEIANKVVHKNIRWPEEQRPATTNYEGKATKSVWSGEQNLVKTNFEGHGVTEQVWSVNGYGIESTVEYIVLWHRKLLKNDAERLFMGDLFTNSMVCDALLHKVTRKIIRELEKMIQSKSDDKNWKIMFHISKLIEAPPDYRGYIDMFYNPW